MTTARDILKSALRKIHVIGLGAPLNPELADSAFITLNAMLASFSASGGLIYTQNKETYPLTSASAYTIGVGGDFDTARPLHFNAAYVTQGELDYPLYEMDAQQFAALSLKDTDAAIPTSYYFDANYPLGTITLYPKPSGVSSITLYGFSALDSFVNLDDDFDMPPEYEAFLTYNLAVWIAPEYEREAAPTVQRIARETKNTVLTQNNRNKKHLSSIDVPQRGGSSYNNDTARPWN